eukprot:m.492770 g.492770  ORF g.492770 m.492770 type:complete len:65 (+) comp21785_c0_seq13:288-482(+)
MCDVGATGLQRATQVISIVLSYMLLSKPFQGAHIVGGALFALSIALGARDKIMSKGSGTPAPTH